MKRLPYWLLITVILMIPTACGSPPLIKPENEAPGGANKATPTEANNATQDLTEARSSPLPTPKITQPRSSTPTTVAIAQAVTTPVTTTVAPSPLPPTVPAGPAPSPTTPSLSPLDESLQTLISAASSEQGPAIWRTQVDAMGQIAGPVEPVNFPADTRTSIQLWSPSGKHIAFTQWVVDSFALDEFAIGELHIMTAEGNEEQLLSPLVTHFYSGPFRPVWSSDGRYLAFVMNESPGPLTGPATRVQQKFL